ncbi:MAG: SBBP repeat-containing protein, partial [Candidatus Acidiferrales bacterium]
MSVARGAVALQKPIVYQEINGERREIAGNYVIADHDVRFSVADYDRTQPLTIDPVLNYSTYIGGEALDTADGIALDAAGDAYIAGSTTSTTFPQMNAEAGTPADVALGTAFVSELNPTGSALIYSSYIGGSGNGSFGEGAQAVAVDVATPPNIYITGFTGSPDFPVSTTLAPLQGQPGPASTATGGSAFITKLSPALTGAAQLAYSSYLGGDTFDEGFGIAVDAAGHAFIAGETVFTSTKFPTKGTQILVTPSMVGNAFLTEFDTTASGAASLVYSTYLGGSGAGSSYLFGFGDIAFGVTIDTNSNAYVVGGTTSADFPTAGTAIPGSAACGANTIGSAFISVINTTAGTLGYSQCLSGSGKEFAAGVSLGAGVPAVTTKVAYITGQTSSSNFPVTANTIPVAGGSEASGVAFVSLVNTNSTTPLQYSTFLGGDSGDSGSSIASDALGNAYVAGSTGSSDFPVTAGALQTTNNNPAGTAFVSKIGPNGLGLADLIYSTYYGGQATTTPAPATADLGLGIAVSGTNAYITGQMSASNMLVSSTAFQKALGGGGTATANAFVADLPMVAGISVSPTFINFGTQAIGVATAPQTVTVTNNSSTTVIFTSIAVVPISPAAPATDFAIASGSNTCGASIASGATCTVGVTFTPSVNAAESATLVFTDSDPSSPQSVPLSGTGSNTVSAIAFNPASLTFGPQATGTT